MAQAGMTDEIYRAINMQTLSQMEYAKQKIDGLKVMSVSLSDCM